MSEKKKRKKVVMIGPVYPYKGGIAYNTATMINSLKKRFNVKTVSYKMQYPKLLFRKPQKDYSNSLFKIDDAQFLINTANPFNWINTARKIKKMHPDFIVIHWWHPYFAPCYGCLSFMLRKIPRIFICHNVFPHENFPMQKTLARFALKRGSAYITHSESDAEDLKLIKSAPIFKAADLPVHNQYNLHHLTVEEGRKAAGIAPEKKILLFFGFVREYKGLRHIIKAMPEIVKYDSNIELWVVGAFRDDKDSYMELIKKGGAGSNIKIVDGYIPDEEIEKYFASCDIVVLPYESATQSGIVQMAYGFDKPVIVTDVGGIPEVVDEGKTGYIVPPKDPHALAEAVKRFFSEGNADEMTKCVRAEADRRSWDKMVDNIEELYEKAMRHEG